MRRCRTPTSTCRRPIVIGHRGCAGEAPENTLPSFERGLDDGRGDPRERRPPDPRRRARPDPRRRASTASPTAPGRVPRPRRSRSSSASTPATASAPTAARPPLSRPRPSHPDASQEAFEALPRRALQPRAQGGPAGHRGAQRSTLVAASGREPTARCSRPATTRSWRALRAALAARGRARRARRLGRRHRSPSCAQPLEGSAAAGRPRWRCRSPPSSAAARS